MWAWATGAVTQKILRPKKLAELLYYSTTSHSRKRSVGSVGRALVSYSKHKQSKGREFDPRTEQFFFPPLSTTERKLNTIKSKLIFSATSAPEVFSSTKKYRRTSSSQTRSQNPFHASPLQNFAVGWAWAKGLETLYSQLNELPFFYFSV